MKKSRSRVRLIARIMAFIAIAFISLFALDAFGQGKPFWTEIAEFFIHLIPSIILLIILLISFKKELISGILFLAIGLIATPWVYNNNYAMNNSVGMSLAIVSVLTLPFIIIGILFMISHFRNKKELS